MILKSVGNCIIDFIVSLYTIKIKNRLDYYSGTFYNHWIKRQLGKFGEGSYIGRNCQIQGWGGQSIFVGKNTIIALKLLRTVPIQYRDILGQRISDTSLRQYWMLRTHNPNLLFI